MSKHQNDKDLIRPFDLTKSTPTQLKVMKHITAAVNKKERTVVFNTGGVRSGKSFGAAMALIEHWRLTVHEVNGKPKQYMVMAFSGQLAAQVFSPAFQYILSEMGVAHKCNRSVANPRIVLDDGTEILFRGAGQIGDDKAVQGLTLGGLIVDELMNLQKQVIFQAEARCSEPMALRIYTMNKGSEYHWSVRHYVKRIKSKKIKGLYLDSPIQENKHIEQDYIDEREEEWSSEGTTLERFLHNAFTPDGTPLFKPEVSHKNRPDRVDFIFAIGYDGGIQVVYASWENPATRRCLFYTDSWDYDSYESMEKMFADAHPQTQFFVSEELFLLKNDIIKRGFRCGVTDHDRNCGFIEVMIRACRNGLVKVPHDSYTILEAIDGTNDKRTLEFPTILAFINGAQIILRQMDRTALEMPAEKITPTTT